MAIKTSPGDMEEYRKTDNQDAVENTSMRTMLLEMEEQSQFPKTSYYVAFAWRPFMICLDFTQLDWPYYFPRPLLAFSFILAICMGLAIGALCLWHYYLILTAQTTVEFYNNYYDKSVCKSQGEVFVNMYNFGPVENFKRFFNIGDQYSWYTFFCPIPIPPRGSGRVFEKCQEFYLLPESRQRAHVVYQQESQEIEDLKDA
ncbi:uncharacterized protein B0P05DRAFT_580916 [Gilbertella persicaria]|uniref:uncharacterized protein n=1 Tax=Gilbertella persicaria TaxID=101096 RepID=UPI00221EDA25|nr:uncharacterized protein B0P05DRAFT_580916 [Gilbertella persicaria]KAI8065365.1 hypothetical protein B0P05DRAFT_580916 [Gilbertella persicaria]